jgi:hypothetical protein
VKPMRGAAAMALTMLLASTLAVQGCNRDEDPEGAGTTEIETTEVEESPVEVTGITLGRSVGADNRVIDETGIFRPSDTIYVSVSTEGVAPSADLRARWTYQDGQVVEESSRSIAPNGPEVTEFHVSKPDGWPTGGYEVVILLDGREVDRKSFNVEA